MSRLEVGFNNLYTLDTLAINQINTERYLIDSFSNTQTPDIYRNLSIHLFDHHYHTCIYRVYQLHYGIASFTNSIHYSIASFTNLCQTQPKLSLRKKNKHTKTIANLIKIQKENNWEKKRKKRKEKQRYISIVKKKERAMRDWHWINKRLYKV